MLGRFARGVKEAAQVIMPVEAGKGYEVGHRQRVLTRKEPHTRRRGALDLPIRDTCS